MNASGVRRVSRTIERRASVRRSLRRRVAGNAIVRILTKPRLRFLPEMPGKSGYIVTRRGDVGHRQAVPTKQTGGTFRSRPRDRYQGKVVLNLLSRATFPERLESNDRDELSSEMVG